MFSLPQIPIINSAFSAAVTFSTCGQSVLHLAYSSAHQPMQRPHVLLVLGASIFPQIFSSFFYT
jgi:hypothetical protein